jgi:hypothetical protein
VLEEAKLQEEDFEVAANKSWGTSITVGGEVYATSLFWQPLQNKDDHYTEVGLAAEGILEGADLFCVKGGKSPQFGICVSSEGYKPKTYVAAASLASALVTQNSFVAIFKTDEGWWYTCIRNDIILSDGDMLFLNEEDAKNQFLSMLAVPDWGKKFCPPEWEIEDTEYPELASLLQKGVKSRLQKIKALRGPKLFAVVGVSVLVGLWLLSELVTAMLLTPTRQPIVAPVAPRQVHQPIERPPEIKPWERIREPDQIMKRCFIRVNELMQVSPPGWVIGNITCNSGGASTEWRRQIGRVSWMNKALDVSGITFSGRSVAEDGRSVRATIPLGNLKTVNSPPLLSQQDLRTTLNDLFQALGLNVNLRNVSVRSPENNTYRSVAFNIRSEQDPLIWYELLTKFSGLEINVINYNTGTGVWEYEGAIYAL